MSEGLPRGDAVTDDGDEGSGGDDEGVIDSAGVAGVDAAFLSNGEAAESGTRDVLSESPGLLSILS